VDLERIAKEGQERSGSLVLGYKVSPGNPKDAYNLKFLGRDGLPHIGVYLEDGQPFYRFIFYYTNYALYSE